MNRNFERFEVGHWYKYMGSKGGVNWNTRDGMGDVLDNKHRMCKGVDVSFSTYANFEDVAHPSRGLVWDWGKGFNDWIETDEYGRKLVKEFENSKFYKYIGMSIESNRKYGEELSDNLLNTPFFVFDDKIFFKGTTLATCSKEVISDETKNCKELTEKEYSAWKPFSLIQGITSDVDMLNEYGLRLGADLTNHADLMGCLGHLHHTGIDTSSGTGESYEAVDTPNGKIVGKKIFDDVTKLASDIHSEAKNNHKPFNNLPDAFFIGAPHKAKDRKKPIFTETKKHNVKLLLRKKQKFTIKTEKQEKLLTRK